MQHPERPPGIPPATSASTLAVVRLLFFASGALALIYQVVWSRMLTHVFGSTAVAVGLVLAAYMAGLALGAWQLGKRADRSPNPLRLYAVLEFGIAASALLAHLLLDRLAPAYPQLYAWFGGSGPGLALVRFGSAFLLVMVPTMLMGATLPALSRLVVGDARQVGARVGGLYALNTLGAVCGVLLTGFYLIGQFGLHLPVYAAVAGNLLIGAGAWLAARHVKPPAATPARAAASEREALPPGTARLLLAGLVISGFTSFAYEIFWTRSLVFVLGNSTYALSTMLSAFLAGIALGSYLVRFAIRRSRDHVALFGWLQVALGLSAALALPLLFAVQDLHSLERSLLGMAEQAGWLVTSSFAVSFVVMLAPAMLIGATFPLVSHALLQGPEHAGREVGRIYALNTLGNVLGALLPGLVLLAWLGIQRGIVAMAVLNMVVGLVLITRQGLLQTAGWRAWWRPAAVLALAVLVLPRAPLGFQFPSDGELSTFETLYYREGPLATTKVYRDPLNDEKHISVDGIVIGGTGNAEFKQLLLAHLPRLLVGARSNELSVGLGSGILAGQSALHPDLQALTAVEIEPSVVAGAAYFDKENHAVLSDPRLSLVTDDVANFLRVNEQQWSLVTADEKTADEYASNGFSYSVDYYRLLNQRLTADGLVVQWVPATLPPRQFRMIVRSFTEGFAHAQLWYFLPARRLGPFNAILVGSQQPLKLSYPAIEQQFEQRRAALASLVPYGLTSAEALLPHFVADERTLVPAVADAPVNSLDFPRYEFYHPWDYARNRMQKTISNHQFIMELKRAAQPQFLAEISPGAPDPQRLQQTLAAEFRYLEGFSLFLSGLGRDQHYRLFDQVLAMAPWNDSLRARIYAQYAYLATTGTSPVERQRLMEKARRLYTQP